jgi:hypothetical protein
MRVENQTKSHEKTQVYAQKHRLKCRLRIPFQDMPFGCPKADSKSQLIQRKLLEKGHGERKIQREYEVIEHLVNRRSTLP